MMIILSDNAQRAKNSLIAFYVLGITQVALLFSTFLQYNLLKRIENGNYTQAEAEANDLRHQVIVYSNIFIYIVCIVFFIMWFRRAYFNLSMSTRAYTEFTEGWAAGAWFVPFINLVRPFTIMKEIWVKTQEATDNLITYKKPTILGLWWTLWIINNIGTNISTRLFNSNSLDDLLISTQLSFVVNLIEIAALVLLIIIIKNVNVFEQNLQQSLLNERETESEDKLNFIV